MMGWTLPDVWDLPMPYYTFLVDELNAFAAKAEG